jgi:hypothetical protein
MDQAAITLQHRISRLDRKTPKKAKKSKPWKLKSAWYRPPTLASLSKPYKRMPWVPAGTTAIKGGPSYNSRVPLCPSNWPSDIQAFYAGRA